MIHWAVVTIQRIVRAKIGRRKFRAHALAIKKFRADRQVRSATQIQKVVRGRQGRLKFKKTFAQYLEEKQLSQWNKYGGKGDGKKKKKSKLKDKKGDEGSSKLDDGILGDDENDGDADNSDALKRISQMEKSIAEKDRRLAEALRVTEERAVQMERALREMENRMKQDEAERFLKNEMMMMAAGPISTRSDFGSARGQGSHRKPLSARYPDNPPTARSARDPSGIPADAPRFTFDGKIYVQLWDPVERAHYWYCEKTKEASWERPDQVGTNSGYESAGGVTDYSTDYESGGDFSEAGENSSPWGEYWDEQAQAKYWYNSETGEATWTKPAAMSVGGIYSARSSSNSTSSSVPPSARNGKSGNEWISYIDEATGQEYWYNSVTGETSWS